MLKDKQIIEHKLLYEGLDWSVGVDGMFINPKQIPYTNCLYELALACDSKSKQLKAKEQAEEKLVKQIQTICDFINNRPEIFKGINGSVDKIITDYAERKEQECEHWKHQAELGVDTTDILTKELEEKEQECEELKQGYAELTEIVNPYMDDFTGYNEELGGFDIVLCVKELLQQLDQLKIKNKELKDIIETKLDNANICDTALNYINDEYIYVKRQLDQLKSDNDSLKSELMQTNCYLDADKETIDQLKAENEQYKNVINKLAGKTIAITSYDKPTEFCDHKDLTIQQLKAENERLKEEREKAKNYNLEYGQLLIKATNKNNKLKQTLTEIKDVLNFYANSKIGEQQEDGSYKILLNGGYITIYNPKLARQALRKISEVEDGI